MARKNTELDLVVKAINVDSTVWADAQAQAKEDGLSMSELIRNVLKVYVDKGSPTE